MPSARQCVDLNAVKKIAAGAFERMRTAMERRPYRRRAAVYAGGAMHGRAAVPSAAARRQDGGSPYRGAHYGEPPSRRLFAEVAKGGADWVG